ncbi:hypothetical protein F5879DRAFT_939117 [Lentinula edodes]|nr:hypothetical protein F5879DRAFT_939117 [Lentinula edodes]
MSHIATLTRGEILAGMFANSSGNFHWAVFIVNDQYNAFKLHAKQYGSYWRFENPPPMHNLLRSASLSAMVKIGQIANVDSTTLSHIVDLMSQIRMSVPSHEYIMLPGAAFDCRVWFREAVRKLHDNGYINCPNVWSLFCRNM